VGVPGDIWIRDSLVIPASEVRWRFSRASGPGGQGVNTTDSRVELVYDLGATTALPPHLKRRALEQLAPRLAGGVLAIVASAERSQLRNRQEAEHRLRELLLAAIATPPAPRRRTGPTRGSAERRLAEKKRRGEVKRVRRGQGRGHED
jgi:ribosome-associated protein